MEKDGRRMAEITYAPAGDGKINANHTYVDHDLRGGGIAQALLDALADYAREQNVQIIPTCSYVVAKFSKSSKYNDVNALAK
ncbi:hypothetical protein SAMN05443094_101188 [Domibacillus enclensis]|nr:hypothetical protein SAMN05443094_101188 [Domibacillus enclensis]